MADLRVLALTHLIAAGFGFTVAPRELLETDVKHSGFFKTDTKRVLAAAVDSLRKERRLAVYSFKGFAAVSIERDGFLFFNGHQELIVPASIVYFVDLSQLTPQTVTLDETTNVVTIRLPALTMGDVAIEAESARAITGGILGFSPTQVQELTRLNFATARRAFHASSQNRTLVQAAQTEAKKSVESHFEIPFRLVGRPDIRVVAVFDNT